MNTIEFYNRRKIKNKLKSLYNETTYSFELKDNTINYIIKKWNINSIKFSKYNALDNIKNKLGELILWKYKTLFLYTKNKSKPFKAEYFIWLLDNIIARGRISFYYFFVGTWYTPPDYAQLFIIQNICISIWNIISKLYMWITIKKYNSRYGIWSY